MEKSEIEELLNLLDEYISDHVEDDNEYIEFSSIKNRIEETHDE